MSFYANTFIFDGVSCDHYGLELYNLDSASQSAGAVGGPVSISETRTASRCDGFYYGDITNEPFYEEYMGLKTDPETAYHAINSRGKNVVVEEDGWAEIGTEPNYMMLHFIASCGKAFYGGVGNTLWVDNVEIVM